jgi:hypothetical protein
MGYLVYLIPLVKGFEIDWKAALLFVGVVLLINPVLDWLKKRSPRQ